MPSIYIGGMLVFAVQPIGACEREQFTLLQKMAKAKSEIFETEFKMMLSSDAIGQVEIVDERAFHYYNSST